MASGAGVDGHVQMELQEFRCASCNCGIGETINLHASSSQERASDVLPEQRKNESLEKWTALPTKLPATKPPKAKFVPLSFLASQNLYLGKTRDLRNEELWKAASSGFVFRLEALMAQGVDLEAKNEYGQTALFLAASSGYSKAVKFLIWAGADVLTFDTAGASAFESAVALKRHEVIPVMKSALLDADAPKKDTKAENLQPQLTWDLVGPFTKPGEMVCLIPLDSGHPGAGTCYIDNAFQDSFMDRLRRVIDMLPLAEPTKVCSNDRSYFCDSLGWVSQALTEVILTVPEFHGKQVRIFPNMRILKYTKPGSSLPAHVDLTRVDPTTNITSTHTFLLYTTDCGAGGETVLLEKLKAKPHVVIGKIEPKVGRLCLMPHMCPHEGGVVEDVPKVLLRGEFYCFQPQDELQ